MIVELHIIQNFAPSNLNRDDANAPKDCIFGGYRRARISSQCIKRSVRKHPEFVKRVGEAGGDVGVRTKRIKSHLEETFTKEHGKSEEEAKRSATAVIKLLGWGLKDEEKTEYLLYLGKNEIAEIVGIAVSSWDHLWQWEKKTQEEEEKKQQEHKEKGRGKKDKKQEVPDELKTVKAALTGALAASRKEAKSYAADVALFGRMVADDKNMNVDAACQVAHAISTHRVEMEMDYFTAVDDLLPGQESGSDMIGVVEFNSACFYRYSTINIDKLRENLGPNDDLLTATVLAYVEGSVKAVPTGKQNSMGAQNPPSYVRVVVRNDGFPWSLANAFQKPVTPSAEESLDQRSIAALDTYFDVLKATYGSGGIVGDFSFRLGKDGGSLDTLLAALKGAIQKEARA